MSTLGNILWILLGGGLVTAIEYFLGGLALCVTIVGIPFGVQSFKLAELSLLPFGKQIDVAPGATGCLSGLMNLLWLVVAGLWIALSHLIFAVGCALTIIGIPFAVQHLKLAKLALLPFGRQIR